MELLTEKKCSKCGGKVIRKGMSAGYTSASELDRPPGAKGRDEFVVADVCEDCGSGAYHDAPVPCHICGGKDPDIMIDICDRSGILTGIFDWVPGLPNCINLCASCQPAIDKKIERLVNEAVMAGGYE